MTPLAGLISFFTSEAFMYEFEYFIELVLSGVVRGSIYGLIALGYTMVYGVIGLINFAHGEIYMIGAFVGLIVAGILTILGWHWLAIFMVALVVAMVYSAAYGYTLEKIAYKPLRKAPRLSPLISALGMSIFLQNYVLLSQNATDKAFPQLLPQFQFLEEAFILMRTTELAVLVTTALVMVSLYVIIKHTRTGMAMRAISQDREMAMLLGVNVDRVISMTFIIGSTLAAVGGVLVGTHIGLIKYSIGFLAGIKAFTAAVLGGIGSIPGAALGGLILGLTESFAAGYVSSAYEDVFAFGLLVLILIFKPAGLLGRVETDKV